METRQHTSFRAFIKQHAVLTFYILVFALSWGPTLIIGGPGALQGAGHRRPTDIRCRTRSVRVSGHALDLSSSPWQASW